MVWEKLSPRKPQQYYSRLYVLAFLVCLGLAGLCCRLLWMQVWQGAEYRRLADSNSVRTVPIRAPRGLILDRHLKVLAGNQPSLSLGLTPAELLRQPELVESVIARLSQELGLDPEDVKR